MVDVAIGESFLPHYAVCRSIARIFPEALAEIPNDVAFVSKDLKQLAARVCWEQRVDVSQCGEDVAALVRSAEEQGQQWTHWVAKDRSCAELKMKIGEFALFPEFRDRVCPEMFTLDLIDGAQRVLRFLEFVAENFGPVTEETTVRRYPEYLRVAAKLHKNGQQRLLPPADVAVVHFSHMLQSKEYREFLRSLGLNDLESMPHCSMWLPSDAKALDALAKESKKIWSQHSKMSFKLLGFSWSGKLFGKRKPVMNSYDDGHCGVHAKDPRRQGYGRQAGADYDHPSGNDAAIDSVTVTPVHLVDNVGGLSMLHVVVADDRSWFLNFLKAHGKTVFERAELEAFVLGYQKYLYLLAKYPMRMERIGFAPNPSIDLIWHTHLVNPRAYYYDVGFLCHGVTHHKLLPREARRPFAYDKHVSDEAAIWEEEFGETLQLWKRN